MTSSLQAHLTRLKSQISTIIVGKPAQIDDSIACLLAGGHLLIEDVPGVGKTTLAHVLAVSLGLSFSRVQFTADLMPSDLVGVSVYERSKEAFVFHKGPVFAQVLLADEINRAGPKTQSALLEAMEEQQVSVDGETRPLPLPFFVIATQNPGDQLGTYALPESQLDRFLMCITLGYPDAKSERELLAGQDRREAVAKLAPVMKPAELVEAMAAVRQVHVSESLLDYLQALIAATRSGHWFSEGLSPRAGIGVLRLARARALLAGRDFVSPDDLQAILPQAIAHRLIPVPGAGRGRREQVRAMIESVSLPLTMADAALTRPSFLDARGRWRAWWDARRQPRESQTLTQRNIYIVPSRAGLAFCATLLLLVVSINYQLSLGFALTFLLAGSAAASMQMTHGSLRGLTLHLKPLVPAFDGEAAVLEVVVTNPGKARLGVGFGMDLGVRPIPLAYAEIAAQGQTSVHLSWLAPGRGLHALPVLRAESRYPFGLFRAWTIWRPAGQQWVYPRPETPTPPWPQAEAAQGDDRHAARTGSGTEFEGVRAYRRGDTLRQVVWKKAARTGEMISRETAGAVQREMRLQWSQAQGLDTEARLSRLAAWVVAADAAGHAWGLRLPGTDLAPDNGSAHRHAALQALARW